MTYHHHHHHHYHHTISLTAHHHHQVDSDCVTITSKQATLELPSPANLVILTS